MRTVTLIALLLPCTSACGFSPSNATSSSDAAIDAPIDVPASAAPVSCAAVLAATPGAASGSYEIDPDGTGGEPSFTARCDMDTNGGGWTLVFMAPSANVMRTPVNYTSGTNRLMQDAHDVLIAYRDASFTVKPHTAQFALPDLWKSDAPFNLPGNDVLTPVAIDFESPTPKLVRFGYGTFTTTCDDPWTNTVQWGRICIESTVAPFYTGFAATGADTCVTSAQDWSASNCAADALFSIAVR